MPCLMTHPAPVDKRVILQKQHSMSGTITITTPWFKVPEALSDFVRECDELGVAFDVRHPEYPGIIAEFGIAVGVVFSGHLNRQAS